MARALVMSLLVLVLAASVYAQAPPAPTNLVAQLVQGGINVPAVKLTWEAPTGPWSYRVYRSTNDTTHFHQIGNTFHRVFYDYYTMPGNTYYYYVKSVSGNLQSDRSNVASILITPRPRGTISGTVIDDTTSLPIRHVRIRFFRIPAAPSLVSPVVYTDSLGRYTANLDTGTYLVKAEGGCNTTVPCYIPEYYDNSPTPQGATPVPVTENSTFVANFGLSRQVPPTFAHIEGVVTDTLNVPLRHASVAILRTMQEMNYLAATTGTPPGNGSEAMTLDGVGHTRGVVWRGYTDSLGRYRARVISGRSYIALSSKHGYIPEYFDNKPSATTADIIHVTRDTTGINFSLEPRPLPQNSISGIVRDSLGTRVPSRILLITIRPTPTPHLVRYGHTDSLGEYTINNVWEGNYFVLALPFSQYAPAFYKEGEYGVRRIQDADTVHIVGNVTGINVGVVPITSNGLARISGRVRTPAGAAITGVRLTAVTPQNQVVGIGLTDATGSYNIDAVLSGSISIIVDRDGYNATQGGVNIGSSTFNVNNVDFVMTPLSTTSADEEGAPLSFRLEQNYPNPFNPSTTITYELSAPAHVTLTVFDVLGREIATLVNGSSVAGSHNVIWDGTDSRGQKVASGVYFYSLRRQGSGSASSFTQVMRMLLVK